MVEKNKKKKKGHPKFKRPNVGRTKRSRLKDKWRKPRGKGNKQRQKLKQAGRWPTIGYKNPKKIRGKHPTGVEEIVVNNVKDVETIQKETEKTAIRIASKVGKKKRIDIIKKADEKGLRVLNR